MKNIFLENYTQNVVKKLFPDPFLKNKNWTCFDQYEDQFEDNRNIVKLSFRPFAFTLEL